MEFKSDEDHGIVFFADENRNNRGTWLRVRSLDEIVMAIQYIPIKELLRTLYLG